MLDNTRTTEILLYYIYTEITDPQAELIWQKNLCEKLKLTGRIIISNEGLNGTVAGTKENTQAYIDACLSYPLLKDMKFKRSEGIENSFPKLSIKVRNEIVSGKLKEDEVYPVKSTGKRVTPEELHAWFQNNEEFEIIDMRNSYEFELGHFKNSIDPGMRRFEDLPEKMPVLNPLKNKKILTVCTGGVRCEKASGYLLKKGFEKVYQLDGGIVSYMEKYPGQDFEGSLFVFDRRKTMHFNGKNHTPISECLYCKQKSERFTNCKNSMCNAKMIACENCVEKGRKRLCNACETNKMNIDLLSIS